MPLYEFCIDGATLRCWHGSDSCKFRVPNQDRAKQGGKHVGTRIDRKSIYNIPNFGTCRISQQYNFSNKNKETTNALFFGNLNDVKMNSSERCMAKHFSEWMNVHDWVTTQDEPNLIFRPGDSSYTFCEYGGYITFEDSGQKTPSDMTAEELTDYFALNCPDATPEEIDRAVKDFMTLNDYIKENEDKLANPQTAAEALDMPTEVLEASMRMQSFNGKNGVMTAQEMKENELMQEACAAIGYDSPEMVGKIAKLKNLEKERNNLKDKNDTAMLKYDSNAQIDWEKSQSGDYKPSESNIAKTLSEASKNDQKLADLDAQIAKTREDINNTPITLTPKTLENPYVAANPEAYTSRKPISEMSEEEKKQFDDAYFEVKKDDPNVFVPNENSIYPAFVETDNLTDTELQKQREIAEKILNAKVLPFMASGDEIFGEKVNIAGVSLNDIMNAVNNDELTQLKYLASPEFQKVISKQNQDWELIAEFLAYIANYLIGVYIEGPITAWLLGKFIAKMERLADGVPKNKYLKKSLMEWAENKKRLLATQSNRRARKFNTATLAYDAKTGEYFYGMNRGITLKGDPLNSQLAKLLPEKSLNKYPSLINCSEIDAVNQALNNGSDISNIYLYTIDTTPINFGISKSACENCTFTLKDNVRQIITGNIKTK